MSSSESVSVDVLVVGAGACGLVAALRASQMGASVAVLEKLGRFAGNTMLSSGSIPAAGTRKQREAGIADSVETMIADMDRVAGPHEAGHLTRVLAERSAELVDWLEDYCGVEIVLHTHYKHVGHTIPRLHTQPSGRGSQLIESLAQAARRADIEVLFNNPVRRLLTNDHGQVVGAEAGHGQPYRIDAASIILATNGFGANRQLLGELCPEIAGAPYFGAQGSEGEAVIWGRELDARFANLGAYQAHASVSSPHGELLTWSCAEKGAIYVNRAGRRFGNESLGYSGFAALVMAQGNEAYAVYDASIRDHVAKYQPPYQALVEMGAVREAAGPKELAGLHGLDGVTLSQTLERYNRAARGEVADEFGRRDFGLAPLQAPFVITRVNSAIFHTQGGLLVDESARVLRADGSVIDNLYAGGGAAAGVSGATGGAGYVSGNGLLAATVLGYIAGEAAGRALENSKSGT